MGTLLILGVRCPYCQKHRSPLDILHQPGGVTICTDCEQKHVAAVAALGTGEFHGECSECGEKGDQPNRLMEVHYEGGKYRLMCMTCSSRYVLKRMELYGGTPFAREVEEGKYGR